MKRRKIILAITGASATLYGARLAKLLGEMDQVELHLIFTEAAKQTLRLEGGPAQEEVLAHADRIWQEADMAASISSGSFLVEGMIVLPCSMKSLAAIALGLNDNLVARAADVQLKERRKLVLCPRETPLNQTHLEHMLKLTQMGAVILPPLPAFYHKPENIDDLIDHSLGKILDQFGLEHQLFSRWEGA